MRCRVTRRAHVQILRRPPPPCSPPVVGLERVSRTALGDGRTPLLAAKSLSVRATDRRNGIDVCLPDACRRPRVVEHLVPSVAGPWLPWAPRMTPIEGHVTSYSAP